MSKKVYDAPDPQTLDDGVHVCIRPLTSSRLREARKASNVTASSKWQSGRRIPHVIPREANRACFKTADLVFASQEAQVAGRTPYCTYCLVRKRAV